MSFGAHGSTGKPEPAFQSAENALTVQDHIRGVRRSGPHEVLRMQDKVRNKLTKRQYENGSELVDVDVARAGQAQRLTQRLCVGGGAHSFGVGDRDRDAARWGWGRRGALL